jgi:SAM-dependent methyltransferase
VTPEAWGDTSELLESTTIRSAIAAGQWIESARLGASEAGELAAMNASLARLAVVLEHPRVEFPTFPYEWIPEMLFDAARLTLDLSARLAAEGATLKDATPFNVLFEESRPVWVDVTSVERRDPLDPTWRAYGQFHRSFLLPLLALRSGLMTPAQIFLANREGLEAEQAAALGGPWRKWWGPWISLATIPAWLGGSAEQRGPELYQGRRLKTAEEARFVLDEVFRSLGRQLESVRPSRKATTWSGYIATTHDATYYARREEFVRRALAELQPRKVLDVGANTGQYSIAAAKSGATVVSLDSDAGALAHLYEQARDLGLPILPVLANLAHPSPGTGWQNQECAALLERLENRFDGVFMLAVLHHLLVTERVPMPEVVSVVGRFSTDWLLIEYIAPHDELFRRIARGRDALYAHLTRDYFEECFGARFSIANCIETMEGRRWLYLLKKKV